MRNRLLVNRAIFACGAALAFVLASGCGSGERIQSPDRSVRFIHATDPHVFLEPAKSPDDEKRFPRDRQQSLNEIAVSDMWKQILSISSDAHRLSFVVLTGDFGVDPCSIASKDENGNSPTGTQCLDVKRIDDGLRGKQVEKLAALFGQSSISDVYLVAGNNDIPSEMADEAGLVYFNQFIDDVQRKIDENKKSVHLHNLTRCYVKDGIASTCYADISDTSYRLIGFPSYSFKNRDTSRQTNTAAQEKQFEIFRALLDQAHQAGKMVVVVTHIPLIDDPYTMARDFYGTPVEIDRDADNAQSKWSTWNVSKKLSDEWEEAIASDSVVGVLAGHLHDSHKEIYRAPYTWSKVNDPKNGFGKLYMAPPLALKNQETSPIQARGFALVGLDRDRITHLIYWYNSEAHNFVPDRAPDPRSGNGDGRSSSRWSAAARASIWLWRLTGTLEKLDRMAVLLIAFLAAFLTVVQVWQIPSPDDPQSAQTPQPTKGGQNDAAKTQAGGTKSAYEPSPFASNFGKTVITGLGGLAAETVLTSFGNKPSADDKEFYVVWFVIFFFLILVLGAFLRAVGEALRERVTIVHLSYQRPTRPMPKRAPGFWGLGHVISFIGTLKYWISYWLVRIGRWLLSLRSSFLILLDTFINLIQGKNQTLTRVFSDTVIKQQRNMICVAQTVRTYLNDEIRQRLLAKFEAEKSDKSDKEKELIRNRILDPRSVRVNISVLSADQSTLFYIARTPGSPNTTFNKRSVAWVSVFTGKIRWYMHDYLNKEIFKEIILFNNEKGVIADDERTIYLNSHYQQRDDDYDAFVVFPIPWPRRGYGSAAVKGAIHISFSGELDFKKLWKFELTDKQKNSLKEQVTQSGSQTSPGTESHTPKPTLDQNDPVIVGHTYQFEDEMLGRWCIDPETRASLRQAVAVLGGLLCGFNENIFLNSKKSNECCEG